MTLTIEVAPETQSWLQSEASRRGTSAERIASEMLDELKATLLENQAQEDREDIADARRILAESKPNEWRTLDDLRHELRKTTQ